MCPQRRPAANLSQAGMDLAGTVAYFLIGYDFCIPPGTFQQVPEAPCSGDAFLQRII